MVKIVIMDWDSFSKKLNSDTLKAIERGKFKKEGKTLYAESLEAARSMLSRERLRLLSEVKRKKPSSLYQLAKQLGKDMKTVHTDASMLSKFGLLSLDKHVESGKVCLRPTVTHRKITLEIAV
jgi:predicted transcriptional regulator